MSGREAGATDRGDDVAVVILGARFEQAVTFALEQHRDHRRKATDVPYVAHLLGVASLVLEAGGDEEAAIAALLHDVVEDCGVTPEELEATFGPVVAGLVVECTDEDEHTISSSPARKVAGVRKVPTLSPAAAVVFAADKLHNARSILTDLREVGDSLWDRFNVPKTDQLSYYRGLTKALGQRPEGGVRRLAAELRGVVERLDELAAG